MLTGKKSLELRFEKEAICLCIPRIKVSCYDTTIILFSQMLALTVKENPFSHVGLEKCTVSVQSESA